MNKRSSKTDSNIKLVQFKLSEKAHNELEELKVETGSLTLSEVIRDSIKLYKQTVELKKKGYSFICFPDDDNSPKYEVVIPV